MLSEKKMNTTQWLLEGVKSNVKKMQEMKFLHAEKTELLENSLLKASFLLKKITAAKYPSSNEFLLQ